MFNKYKDNVNTDMYMWRVKIMSVELITSQIGTLEERIKVS